MKATKIIIAAVAAVITLSFTSCKKHCTCEKREYTNYYGYWEMEKPIYSNTIIDVKSCSELDEYYESDQYKKIVTCE